MMKKDAKIYVASHRGMIGSALVRELQRQGYTNIIARIHKELDLTRQEAVALGWIYKTELEEVSVYHITTF